jgi:hypothetical protein
MFEIIKVTKQEVLKKIFNSSKITDLCISYTTKTITYFKSYNFYFANYTISVFCSKIKIVYT